MPKQHPLRILAIASICAACLVFSACGAPAPNTVAGTWLATVAPYGWPVRVQLNLHLDDKGQYRCSLDDVDVGVFDTPCANATLTDDSFSFDVPAASGHWTSKLSSDRSSMTGTWKQKNPDGSDAAPRTITLSRQKQRLTFATTFAETFDEPIDPVDADDLQAVLTRDLAHASKKGALAPTSPIGVAIGVLRNGERHIFSFGKARPDAIFEIGSISKTFTGLMLALMIEQGKVTGATPVRELLPLGIVAKPAGDEITLLDLAIQHSGLPYMPSNFQPANPLTPFVDYDKDDLYEFMRAHGVTKPDRPSYVYSNVGFDLLGQALVNRAQVSYAQLLRDSILDPLGMHETAIALSDAQKQKFISGHRIGGSPANAWDQDPLPGSGGIRSTVGDMLAYLDANLRPRTFDLASTGTAAKQLAAALIRSHELQADAGIFRIAYAWKYDTATGSYWHNGSTGGYSSFALFNPGQNYAAIVLTNVGVSPRGTLADALGRHIDARLAGKKALSLSNW